jgi:hypothetical protein
VIRLPLPLIKAATILRLVAPVGRGVVVCPFCERGCFGFGIAWHLNVRHGWVL